MIEPLYGSGSPVWMALPSTGLAFQPTMPTGSHLLSTPLFGQSTLFNPSTIPGSVGSLSNIAQSAPASGGPPANAYGYNAGLTSIASQGLVGPGVTTAFPIAALQPALMGLEGMPGVTAPALLAAVAMRRGQPQGPTTDPEIEDFIYDALDLLPGATDVEVRCEGGRLTLTGNVQHKRVKRDVGEIAWAIPAINDVQNNVTIASRRRARAANRDADTPPNAPARKQA